MRGSIQRRGKNLWRLVFDLERDQTGRRRQKVVSFKGTRHDAEREVARLIVEIQHGGFIDPGKLTVAEYLERWLSDHAALRTSPKSFERYCEICRQHIIPALGSRRITKLHSMHIQTYYAEALKSGRLNGNGGLSKRTVQHIHRILRMALQQAVRSQILARNPTDAVDPPKPERKEIIALDEEHIGALLEAAFGKSIYVPILLAVTTGLRRSEVLALRWCDVDLSRATLAVRQSLEQTKSGLRFKSPKTERSKRAIALPSITVDALRLHRLEQAELKLKLGIGWDETGLVCARYDGEPRSPHAFSRAFARFVEKIDIPHITFHGLRHSHATQMLRHGIHPKVAQERLGHSTIATTMDLYSHVDRSMQEDAAIRIDGAIRTVMGKRSENSD